MKRILSILLSLTICLTLLPSAAQVQAASVADLSYKIIDGQVTITDCKGSASGSLTIPATIDGYPVTSIGYMAFNNCDSLTSVTIPDGVTSIGNEAFYYCKSLTSVTIPGSVTSIGDYAFIGCSSLTGIIVSKNNPSYSSDSYGVLYTKDKATLIQAPGAISGAYTIPNSVTSIDVSAFYYCESLTSVTIPASVTSIGHGVFSYCSSLTSVTIPSSVTSVGSYAFSSCYHLTSLYFAGNTPSIGNAAFYRVYATLYYHAGTSGWTEVTSDDLTKGYGRITLQGADHIWSSYTYDNNHTCTLDGTERAVCLTCGETDIRKVEGSADHRFVYTSNNDATCVQDGTKTGKCRLCGIVETVTDEGSALDHIYSVYTSNNDATCTQDGTKSATCANCGRVDTVTEENTALGHSFINYTFDNNYTCTLDGTETAKCDRCDETHLRVVSGTAAHRYVDGTCIFCDQAAPAPNSAELTGKLTAYGKGTVQLTLTPVGETTPAATQTTADGIYSFRAAPGDYILTISQECTVTRTYTVTLTEGQTALDVKLHQPGDINGDGRYNVGDVARIYGHVKASVLLADYELLCADYNGDGRINVGDVAKVYALIKSK